MSFTVLLIVTALVLTGCASTSQQRRPSQPPFAAQPRPLPTAAESPSSLRVNASPLPTLSATGPRKGAYYLDDGPGASPPPDLDLLPDAEPRVEPYASGANRPYNVFGTDYVPTLADRPFKQRGIGSWYGRKFHGQKTSSGEIYDMYAMTAAHPTLPIPSYVRVTNPANGKSVIVRINDRGPFHSERIIDLSFAAAAKLGYANKGSAMIEVERLLPRDILAGKFRVTPGADQPSLVAGAERAPAPATAQATVGSGALGPDPSIPSDLLPEGVVVAQPVSVDVVGASEERPQTAEAASIPIARATAIGRDTRGYFLQLGAFHSRAAADEFIGHLALELPPVLAERLQVDAANAATGNWFRVQLGPYANRNRTGADLRALRQALGATDLTTFGASVVVLKP